MIILRVNIQQEQGGERPFNDRNQVYDVDVGLWASFSSNAQQRGSCLKLWGLGVSLPYSPPEVDGIWGIWGSYYNIPKAIFYLLQGDYNP